MKFTFFKIIVGIVLALGSVKAMDEEEKSKLPQAKFVQCSNNQREEPLSEDVCFGALSDELLLSVFSLLDINDLGRVTQVSAHWKRVTDDLNLWRYIGLRNYGDYLSKEDLIENPKQKVIQHYLSVIVNTMGNSNRIDRIVNNYNLILYVPSFKKYIDTQFLFNILENQSSFELLITQGSNSFEQKIWGLIAGSYGYKKDPDLAEPDHIN